VLDKTGTLTAGKPTVAEFVVVDGAIKRRSCNSAAIERLSEHPLAAAVVEYASELFKSRVSQDNRV
jgi:cation transport ATPase